MSKKIYEKEAAMGNHYCAEEKENVYPGSIGKLVKRESDVEWKKRLLASQKKGKNGDAMINTIIADNSVVVSNMKFEIYSDENNESTRSRARTRKSVCKKNNREGTNGAIKKSVDLMNVMKKKRSATCSVTPVVLQRANSLNNDRVKCFSERKEELNVKPPYRSCSASRYSSCKTQRERSPCTRLPEFETPKVKFLSNKVKQRTYSSIQAWKNKMSQLRVTNTVSKMFSTARPAASTVTNTDPKNKLENIYNINCTYNIKLACQKSTGISSDEINQVQPQDPDECGKKRVSTSCTVDNIDTLKTVVRDAVTSFSSGEFIALLQKNNLRVASTDISMSTSNRNNTKLADKLNSNDMITTPLVSASTLPLTPTKVHYEKSGSYKLQMDEENFDNINKMQCEPDYLENLLETEIRREKDAPTTSSLFLRKNINSEQRKIIVRYLIRLGMHCHYSSSVIYQTVKLFDVASDRIVVDMNQMQLLALACLWLILKRDAAHHKIPTATKILLLAKDMYINEEKQLLMYERKILSSLKFNMWFADPFSLLIFYIWTLHHETNNFINRSEIMCIYFCGSYFIDMSMLDENLCNSIPICVVVQAALQLSLNFVFRIKPTEFSVWNQYCKHKVHRFEEWEEKEIIFVERIMIKMILESERSDTMILYKKYLRSKYGRISHFILEKTQEIVKNLDI